MVFVDRIVTNTKSIANAKNSGISPAQPTTEQEAPSPVEEEKEDKKRSRKNKED